MWMNEWTYSYHLGSETGSSAQYLIANLLLCSIKAFLSSIPASYIFWFYVTEFSKNFSSLLLKLLSKILRKALVCSGIVVHTDELSVLWLTFFHFKRNMFHWWNHLFSLHHPHALMNFMCLSISWIS